MVVLSGRDAAEMLPHIRAVPRVRSAVGLSAGGNYSANLAERFGR